jgi:hypothetical protein
VMELRKDGHGSDRVDAAEAAEPSDRLTVGIGRRHGRKLRVESPDTLLELRDCQQVVLEDRLIGAVLESRRFQPSPMRLGPSLPPTAVDESPALEKLRQPMATAEEVRLRILSTSAQIADRFRLRGRGLNCRQQAGPKQLRQLTCITPVRLDPVPGLDRNQRRGDNGAVATASGKPYSQRNVLRDMKRVLKRAKLPTHFSLHSLRHSYAAQCIAAGENVYYVSRQLGHASTKLTLDTYGR